MYCTRSSDECEWVTTSDRIQKTSVKIYQNIDKVNVAENNLILTLVSIINIS